MFGISCWQLWKRRNEIIFSDNFLPFDVIFNNVIDQAKIFMSAMLKLLVDVGPARALVTVSWRRPPQNYFKLNTDASINSRLGVAFGGGVIRDSDGKWISGFVCNIGVCSIFHGEMWSLFQGLLVAKNIDISHIYVECDNKLVIDSILDIISPSSSCMPLIKNIKQIATGFTFISFSHIHREANFTADYLSHFAYNFPTGSHVLDVAPRDASEWLSHDLIGVSYTR